MKGAFIVGGAFGKGRVYAKGNYVGDTSMTQATVGLQIGGQGYSEIVFFQDERAFLEFTGGNFEFGADAQAVVVTASAQAQTSTTGSSAGASASRQGRGDRGQLLQRHGDVHRHQGRANGRSEHRRPEVQLHTALMFDGRPRAYRARPGFTRIAREPTARSGVARTAFPAPRLRA